MKSFLLFLLLVAPSFAAISASTVWELRTTGDDTNGGGYTSGGTDYSQQDAAQLSVTDGTASGTTTLTSATGGFTTAMVGNLIQISGGSLTAGFYEIATRVDTNTVTLDRTPGTGSGSTVKVGGALATPETVDNALVAGNVVYWKAGTYTRATTWSYAVSGTSADQIYWIGYDTDRTPFNTDTKPLVTTATNSTILITCTNLDFVNFRNLSFSNTAGTRAVFISNSTSVANPLGFDRCDFDGFSNVQNGNTNGATGVNFTFWGCEIKNCTGYAFVGQHNANTYAMFYSYVHSNAGGFQLGAGGAGGNVILSNSIVANNSGRGIYVNGTNADCSVIIENSVLYKNTTANLEVILSAGYGGVYRLFNSVIYGSTDGVKISSSAASDTQRRIVSTNAYGGQSGSATINFDAGFGDITLSADPFVDGDNGNFALNDTAGGGALLRALAYPATFPGGTTDTYRDIGAAQHQGTGGASQTSHSY